MNTPQKASIPVIKRLPKYYRYLRSLQADGITSISSRELASQMGTTASQVRQDFNCIGDVNGRQGIGYSVENLLSILESLLFGNGDRLPTILIGCGRLGKAVSRFITTDTNGYKLIAAFDVAENEVGKEISGIRIRHIDELEAFCEENKPKVAVLCVPRDGAQQVSGRLVDLGIEGFWNFSHYDLSVSYPNVVVENVHLGDSLMRVWAIVCAIRSDGMAKLYFRYGAMNSGKSTALMQVAHNYEEQGMKVLILKPQVDTKGGGELVSRLGVRRKADLLIPPELDVFEAVQAANAASGPLACVLCDESQFFTPEQAEQLFMITVDLNIPVICYGLRADFSLKGFPGSTRLLELAHTIEEMKTICTCGRKAICNCRKVNGQFVFEGEQVAIDLENDVQYVSMCPQCYFKARRAFYAARKD